MKKEGGKEMIEIRREKEKNNKIMKGRMRKEKRQEKERCKSMDFLERKWRITYEK